METKAPIYITVDERKKVYSTDFSFDPARSRELKLFYNFEQNIMDMTLDEILRLRDMAEHTGVQFKERVTKENKSEVAAEMVAMSNTRGGMVVVGIDDKTGRLNPLSYKETQEVTALLGNLATDNVIPGILVDIVNNIDRYVIRNNALNSYDNSDVISRLKAHSATVGQLVHVIKPDGEFDARAVDIDVNGGLVISNSEGTSTLTSGEVVHIR